jgi:hypothetical protein
LPVAAKISVKNTCSDVAIILASNRKPWLHNQSGHRMVSTSALTKKVQLIGKSKSQSSVDATMQP